MNGHVPLAVHVFYSVVQCFTLPFTLKVTPASALVPLSSLYVGLLEKCVRAVFGRGIRG